MLSPFAKENIILRPRKSADTAAPSYQVVGAVSEFPDTPWFFDILIDTP